MVMSSVQSHNKIMMGSVREHLRSASNELRSAISNKGLSTSARALVNEPELQLERYIALAGTIHHIGGAALSADTNEELFTQISDHIAGFVYYAHRMGVDVLSLIAVSLEHRLLTFTGADGEPLLTDDGEVAESEQVNLNAYLHDMRVAYSATAIPDSFFSEDVQEAFTDIVVGASYDEDESEDACMDGSGETTPAE